MILSRYKKIRELVPHLRLDEVLALMPSNADKIKIDYLLETLSSFESVKNALQSETTTIANARLLFNAVVYLSLELRARVGPQAAIIFQPAFKSSIVKLQENRIVELSQIEKNAVACIRKDDLPNHDIG